MQMNQLEKQENDLRATMGFAKMNTRMVDEGMQAMEETVDYISDQLDLVDFKSLGQITPDMRQDPSLFFRPFERLYDDLKKGCDSIKAA